MMAADACLIITFGNAEALDLLTDLADYRIAVCPRVRDEIKKPPAASLLQDAIDNGSIETIALDPSDAKEQALLQQYDVRVGFHDRADAEVLALAVSRGYMVGTDDPAVRRAAMEGLGPNMVAGTLDILVWALRERRMHATDAEQLLATLDVGPHLQQKLERRGKTLRDLV